MERYLADGIFLLGYQGTVHLAGLRAELAGGIGAPGETMGLATMFRLYCAGKPIIAVAVAILVDRGLLDLDRPVGEHLPEFAAGGKAIITLRHILTHVAGLERPNAASVAIMDRQRRHHAVCSLTMPIDWQPGLASSYSEYAGWHVLGCLIESVTGCGVAPFLRDEIFSPLEMVDTACGMSVDEYERRLPHLGVFYDLRHPEPTPMLLDRSAALCCEWNPAYGCYSTAGDLVKLYEALLASLRGDGGLLTATVAREFTQVGRGRLFDPVYERDCDFALGFMIDLPQHGFGDMPSETSFGHTGLLGSSFVVCDPVHGVVATFILNGLLYEPAAKDPRRPAIVSALYQDLQVDAKIRPIGLFG